MLNSSDYAKNYASTIGKSLAERAGKAEEAEEVGSGASETQAGAD